MLCLLPTVDNTADTSIWPTSDISCVQLESDAAGQSSYIQVYHDYLGAACYDDAIGCYGDGDLASNVSTEINDITSIHGDAHKSSMISERQLTSRRSPDSGSSRQRYHNDDNVDELELLDVGEAAVGGPPSSVDNDNALTLVAERDVPSTRDESGPGLTADVAVGSKKSQYKHSFINRIDDLLPPPPSRRQRHTNQQFYHTGATSAAAAAADSVDVVGPTRSSRTVPIDLSSSSIPEAEGVHRVPTSSRTSFADVSAATASRRLDGSRRKVGFSFVSESKF